MIFKHYRFDTIRNKADQFRAEFWGDEIPVDIDAIIEFRLGLEIRPVKSLKSVYDIDGMLSRDLSIIFVDNDMYSDIRYESRLRFTLAHEIGHLVLHRDFYLNQNFENAGDWLDIIQSLYPNDLDWYERHANEFAGRLLVPGDQLTKEISAINDEIEKPKEKAVELDLGDEMERWVISAVARKVCQKFQVSSQTIEIRMIERVLILNLNKSLIGWMKNRMFEIFLISRLSASLPGAIASVLKLTISAIYSGNKQRIQAQASALLLFKSFY